MSEAQLAPAANKPARKAASTSGPPTKARRKRAIAAGDTAHAHVEALCVHRLGR